jgi:hypothetical protein
MGQSTQLQELFEYPSGAFAQETVSAFIGMKLLTIVSLVITKSICIGDGSLRPMNFRNFSGLQFLSPHNNCIAFVEPDGN